MSNYQILTVNQKAKIGNIKVTKREKIEYYSNSMCTYFAYLIHGKIYNPDNTYFRRFKFVIDFDGIDYGEYLEEEGLEDNKKSFDEFLNMMIDGFIESMLSDMKMDYNNGEALIQFCNSTINNYNRKNNSGCSSTQKESDYYSRGKFESIATDLEVNYMDYYNTVLFEFIVEAVKNTIDDLHGIKSLEVMHKHITENYI